MTSLLASPHELCATSADEEAFERARQPALLVELVELIETHFSLRDADWASLLSYLHQHPPVISVLLEAPKAIRDAFGDVRPWLDLVTDPDEDWSQLFIVVPTVESALQGLERLRRLDALWFRDAAHRAEFAINVTVEHV